MITKIDRELAEQIVNTIKDVCDHDINFIAPSGIILASTDSSRVGTFHEIGQQVAASGSVLEVTEDNNFSGTKQGINLPLYHNEHLLAVIGITGIPESPQLCLSRRTHHQSSDPGAGTKSVQPQTGR